MKKLSIVLAIIMALSCFCFTAFAAAVGDACDYKALDEAIAAYDAKVADKDLYTNWAAYKTAYDAAKAVARDLTVDADGANQKKIDDAATALKAAATALKEEETSTTNEDIIVNVEIIWKDLTGLEVDHYRLQIEGLKNGSTITSDTILKTVKARVDSTGTKIIDTEEYVVSDAVVLRDPDGKDGSVIGSVKLNTGRPSYDFVVYVFEINDVENFAQVAATELAGNVDWKGIASANVGLINQVIKGAQAAADSLKNADYPEIGADKTAEATTKAGSVKGASVVKTPNTGASAVAGVAVVVLALSATTAVVLRKKED